MDKIKWILLITFYLLIVTIVSTSIEISLSSELGTMISTDSAGLSMSFVSSCIMMFVSVITFSIPGIPSIWYFFLFYPAVLIIFWIILDLAIRIIRKA